MKIIVFSLLFLDTRNIRASVKTTMSFLCLLQVVQVVIVESELIIKKSVAHMNMRNKAGP